ncbi:NAD(P)H-dependent oxidoreductase [Clostridium oceanicum]|uniref:NAD(P)H-dependent oxidoreductase n=1 Tax=Clostridium oceanicum TaxID=1543 RepID=A0ABN1JLR2_9CLOT
MNFIILNGSPKSEISVTMQSMKYIEKNFKEHSFEYIHIVKEIKKCEKDLSCLIDICEKIKNADGVIWGFPVYHLLVPSYYKRFIELIFERGCMDYFKGKYTSAFSTSIHYYDVTAHEYIHGICDDLNMRYIECLSHEMNDLLHEKGQKELLLFFNNLLFSIKEGLNPQKQHKNISENKFKYNSKILKEKISIDKKIMIVTDAKKEDLNIKEMIKKYVSCFSNKVEVLNLNDIKILGHCLGCCKCAKENICVYHDKDDYRKFTDYLIENADIIIYAGTIKDRYLSSLFKLFYDRSFCYTHIPAFRGKQIGYMISGNLSEVSNLKQILEVYAEADSNLIGFVTDESKNNEAIDDGIYAFAKLGSYYSENNYFRAKNFLGVSAQKIFRDAIAGDLGPIFLGDYKYYKENNIFDYLTLKDKIKYAFTRYFFKKEKVRKNIDKNMINLMIESHKKIISKIEDK